MTIPHNCFARWMLALAVMGLCAGVAGAGEEKAGKTEKADAVQTYPDDSFKDSLEDSGDSSFSQMLGSSRFSEVLAADKSMFAYGYLKWSKRKIEALTHDDQYDFRIRFYDELELLATRKAPGPEMESEKQQMALIRSQIEYFLGVEFAGYFDADRAAFEKEKNNRPFLCRVGNSAVYYRLIVPANHKIRPIISSFLIVCSKQNTVVRVGWRYHPPARPPLFEDIKSKYEGLNAMQLGHANDKVIGLSVADSQKLNLYFARCVKIAERGIAEWDNPTPKEPIDDYKPIAPLAVLDACMWPEIPTKDSKDFKYLGLYKFQSQKQKEVADKVALAERQAMEQAAIKNRQDSAFVKTGKTQPELRQDFFETNTAPLNFKRPDAARLAGQFKPDPQKGYQFLYNHLETCRKRTLVSDIFLGYLFILADLDLAPPVTDKISRKSHLDLYCQVRRDIEKHLDPQFKPDDRPETLVKPPEQTQLAAGVSPEMVKDPALRAAYEAAIAANDAQKRRYVTQTKWHALHEQTCIRMNAFIKAQYSASAEDQAELKALTAPPPAKP